MPPNLDDASVFEGMIQAASPASLLAVIEMRMGKFLQGRLSPEDIYQEAIEHAWRDRGGFSWNGPKSFRRWLLAIIDNRLRDAADREYALKRGGGRHAISLNGANNGVLPSPILDSVTPSRLAVAREQAAAIRAALDTLHADVREVVRLRVLEQVPVEEVAAHLGIGVSAVRHRLARGAAAYRQLLVSQLASRSATNRTI